VEPGTKRGYRLLSGCERLRKLLSQLNDAKITVENLSDNGDANFSMNREEFAGNFASYLNSSNMGIVNTDLYCLIGLCADLLERFKSLLQEAMQNSGGETDIVGIEILGGGIRMPILQSAITKIFGPDKALGTIMSYRLISNYLTQNYDQGRSSTMLPSR
jgi:molecular chaperone DnaK (HSP70)